MCFGENAVVATQEQTSDDLLMCFGENAPAVAAAGLMDSFGETIDQREPVNQNSTNSVDFDAGEIDDGFFDD